MSKEGSEVNNFWAPHYGHPNKCPLKMIKREIFFKFLN